MSKSTKDRAPPLTYGCICSGISAPTLAAKPLGWKTAFFSEIEAFPRAVLNHHYPDTPLHADFTTINRDTYGTVELLVGGTPCQSFSVAGKRLGLDDPRGNLALEYVRLAERLDAKWLVFENVPGLLSSAKGEDFAAFISAVSGHEYRPPATGWQNAGIATGKPRRWGLAWRILDAQYFGVAQRRRRVFVVGYRGDWRPAAAVLLEPEGLRGNPPPSRKARENVAATLAARSTAGGGLGTDFEIDGGLITEKWPAQIASTLNAHYGDKMGLEDQHVNEGCPLFLPVTHSLTGEGFDASEDGTGRGTPLIAFSCKDNDRDAAVEISPTLRSMAHSSSHQNGDGQMAVCYPILEPGARTGVSTDDVRAGIGIGGTADPMFTLQAGKQHGIAVSLRGREGGATAELSGDVMPSLRASQGGGDKPHVLLPSAVRRLTPTECERLQGMSDDYTLIPWRGKSALQCPDGPRYKAIGNSMAVPVVTWIFTRLQFVNKVLNA